MHIRKLVLTGITLLGVAAVACSSASEVEPASTPALPTSEPAPASSIEQSNSPSRTSRPYDPETIMFRIFPDFNSATPARLNSALEEIRARNDTSMVPVLVEALRFLPSRDMAESAAKVMRELTGQEFGGDDWHNWMIWYGKNRDDFQPPKGYLSWKINLMQQLHPRFATFLRQSDGTARIDMTEVVWGGVIPDGIPDLRNPPNIPADEAAYLGLDERVFGVSINGEHRAYPLRIMNPHEMANDMLGDEPIALAY